MNPYDNLPRHSFWKATAAADFLDAGFDVGKKFAFSPGHKFATSGSCFAQHFAKSLAARGGNVLFTETRPHLIPATADHGYGQFSARYGNIYTTRQLLELLSQAVGHRPPICEFASRKDGRYVDMLRPRAVPYGFSSVGDAVADRNYHLKAVRKLIEDLDVLIFTLGLTEGWVNSEQDYCYPVVPGAIAGEFDSARHRFHNFSMREVVADLEAVVSLVNNINPKASLLLTVSPVSLVATAERRSVIVSTVASKSILRAAVDEVVRNCPAADYFPSYEIIAGPYTRGRFWANDGREVTAEGVQTVMKIFFQSRLAELAGAGASVAESVTPRQAGDAPRSSMDEFLDDECEELFLDPAFRRQSGTST